ncbi:MAG: hypothetical protein JSS34_07340 [Proteobacteria bacterium]|nr:hypothetical protein [Pseudomonadota bacterium]
MFDYPLLKYAVNIETTLDEIKLSYRGRIYKYNVGTPLEYRKALENCNGRNLLSSILKSSSISASKLEEFLQNLFEIPLILNGKEILRDDLLMSGKELFWKLEKFLIEWKKIQLIDKNNINLDREIGSGRATENIIKGFCLELCHLLRNVPDELSLAVANAKNDRIRLHYMSFYDEENKHGEIIFNALKKWINKEDILHATPLPGTTGLLNTYRYWASKDSLLYAVALMRDESCALDADIKEEEDIYKGMRLPNYNIPKQVIKVYEWHTNLDRNNNHGFFPELIFSEYGYIDQEYARRLISALKQIIELHQLFRWNVYNYYSQHAVETRFEAYKSIF